MREAQLRMARDRRQGQITTLQKAIESGDLDRLVLEGVVQAEKDLSENRTLSSDQIRLLNTLSALVADAA
jgi:hypothetical protein